MKRVLSIFGDEFFPQQGAGRSAKKRQESVDKLIEFFKTTRPDLVYIMPTRGTCSFVSVLCSILEIPYIMVSPYPNFYNNVKIDDKICIRQAMEKAKSFVLMDDDVPKSEEHGEELYDNSVEFLCRVSDAIVFLYSKDTSRQFSSFMEKTCAESPSKIQWELMYDGGEMLSE
jgi:hypothetical protein